MEFRTSIKGIFFSICLVSAGAFAQPPSHPAPVEHQALRTEVRGIRDNARRQATQLRVEAGTGFQGRLDAHRQRLDVESRESIVLRNRFLNEQTAQHQPAIDRHIEVRGALERTTQQTNHAREVRDARRSEMSLLARLRIPIRASDRAQLRAYRAANAEHRAFTSELRRLTTESEGTAPAHDEGVRAIQGAREAVVSAERALTSVDERAHAAATADGQDLEHQATQVEAVAAQKIHARVAEWASEHVAVYQRTRELRANTSEAASDASSVQSEASGTIRTIDGASHRVSEASMAESIDQIDNLFTRGNNASPGMRLLGTVDSVLSTVAQDQARSALHDVNSAMRGLGRRIDTLNQRLARLQRRERIETPGRGAIPELPSLALEYVDLAFDLAGVQTVASDILFGFNAQIGLSSAQSELSSLRRTVERMRGGLQTLESGLSADVRRIDQSSAAIVDQIVGELLRDDPASVSAQPGQ